LNSQEEHQNPLFNLTVPDLNESDRWGNLYFRGRTS
jgi:hypothetical protein